MIFSWVGGPHTALVVLHSFLCLGVLALEGGCQAVCPLWARLSLPLPPWPCWHHTAFPFLPDRPGVEQRSVVDQLQEQFAIALKAYIEFNRPQPGYR